MQTGEVGVDRKPLCKSPLEDGLERMDLRFTERTSLDQAARRAAHLRKRPQQLVLADRRTGEKAAGSQRLVNHWIRGLQGREIADVIRIRYVLIEVGSYCVVAD